MEGVSPSHVSLTSEDIKPHIIRERGGVQELCESRGGRPGLLAPNSSYGLCGRKATLNSNSPTLRATELCESRGGRPGLPVPVPNSPYGLCGRKATLNLTESPGPLACSLFIQL